MNTLGEGDEVLWAAQNGNVRTGRVVKWVRTSMWLVEIYPSSTEKRDRGFTTWIKSDELIKVEEIAQSSKVTKAVMITREIIDLETQISECEDKPRKTTLITKVKERYIRLGQIIEQLSEDEFIEYMKL